MYGNTQQQQEQQQLEAAESPFRTIAVAGTSASAAAGGGTGQSKGPAAFSCSHVAAGSGCKEGSSLAQGSNGIGFNGTICGGPTKHLTAAAAASTPLWLRGEGIVVCKALNHGQQSQWHMLPPIGVACSTDICPHGKQRSNTTAGAAGPGDVPRLQLLHLSSNSSPGNGGLLRGWDQGEEGVAMGGEVVGGVSAAGGFKGKALQAR